MNIPNLISVARLLLVPVVVWLLISEEYQLALAFFLVAGISDAVDGWVARVTQTQTEIGAYLDPLADKALLVSSYVALGLTKLLPTWLVLTVISRDVLIVGGVLLARFIDQPLAIKPLMISKANTVVQIVFIVIFLAHMSYHWPPIMLITALGFVVAGLTIASGAAYVRDWFRHVTEGTAN